MLDLLDGAQLLMSSSTIEAKRFMSLLFLSVARRSFHIVHASASVKDLIQSLQDSSRLS